MKLGEPIHGLYTDNWRFVEEDLYGITDRVIEYDKDARLACHEDGRLGIARWVQDSYCPGGTWLIAFNLTDPISEDGYWRGEPDARVVDQMARGDMQRQDPAKFARNVKRMLQFQEIKMLQQAKEQMLGDPDKFIFRYRKMEGQKRNIFVP